MADRSSSPLIWIVAAAALFLFLRHNEVGRPAPDFALQGAYGGEYRLDSFRGKPVLLVFWSTNCGICRHELPVLDGLRSEATRNGVEIACVNVGDLDGAREVHAAAPSAQSRGRGWPRGPELRRERGSQTGSHRRGWEDQAQRVGHGK